MCISYDLLDTQIYRPFILNLRLCNSHIWQRATGGGTDTLMPGLRQLKDFSTADTTILVAMT